jgi:hypothetical protein
VAVKTAAICDLDEAGLDATELAAAELDATELAAAEGVDETAEAVLWGELWDEIAD